MHTTRTVPARFAASVVSGPQTVLFGTEPLFRDHPEGEFAQVGRALFTMAHASSG